MVRKLMDLEESMPIKDLKSDQRQGRLFMCKLSEELNPNHKLYKLKTTIDWSSLEKSI